VPPFSLQYCYTFVGKTTEQGAEKIFSNRAEIKIAEQLKHREKQGIVHGLADFLGLSWNTLVCKETGGKSHKVQQTHGLEINSYQRSYAKLYEKNTNKAQIKQSKCQSKRCY